MHFFQSFRRALLSALFVVGLVCLGATATACSSSSSGSGSTPCNQNPWECPSDQTCWPQTTTSFACLNVGPGAQGAACQDIVGSPTCGAGLACAPTATASSGTCQPYCSTTDPSHTCSGGATCETAALGGAGGPELSVCIPPSSSATPDAGATG